MAARVAPRLAGAAIAGGAVLLTPTNTGAETHPITDDLRVRTAPGQRSAIVERRVDKGVFGSGIGAKWEAVPVDAQWASDPAGRRVIAIDPEGLRHVLGPEAAAAITHANGIAMAVPPDREDDDDRYRGRKRRRERENPQPRITEGEVLRPHGGMLDDGFDDFIEFLIGQFVRRFIGPADLRRFR
jgi:hypothetical protein